MDMEEPPPPPGLEIECQIPEAIFSEEEAAVTNSLTLTMVREPARPHTIAVATQRPIPLGTRPETCRGGLMRVFTAAGQRVQRP